ncbi:hypothetical protein REC12_15515 [Desulfosporosinus sp. PR]|uniref:hypothetical protein n=1 Tax=Candidatus Desulfosporosinus nitrosoreducens TaxID=3401928 RepID=UPI0027F749F6|nr:hypothetical protein [Desulfosporosinus sp. PR]MDQ7095004.1 hypothetical protein [Desulfosporosinus sp. PR]
MANSENVNQVDLKGINLKEMTKDQLVFMLSGVISELDLIDRFIEDSEQCYKDSKMSFYADRASGLKAARQYVSNVLLDTLSTF